MRHSRELELELVSAESEVENRTSKDLKNKKKHYVKIDRDTTSEQVLALLDAVEGDQEDKIDNLMNDSDTVFIVEEEIAEEKNENGSNDGGDWRIPDANFHIASAENGEDETKKAKKSKRKQKETPSFTWKKRANLHESTLKAEVITDEMQEHCTPFDMFWKVTNLDELINLIVVQSNLYAQQNGREFQTNANQIMAFLGINYIMSINQLPAVHSYWEFGQFIVNEGIRNMTRQRFKEILRSLHFSDNAKSNNNNKGFKICPVTNHFNKSFLNAVSNDEFQSVDEHMVKFKGHSSMKQ